MGRRFDVDKTRAAWLQQLRVTGAWLEGQDLSGPSSLPAWTRAELVDHIAGSVRMALAVAPTTTREPPLSISDYVSAYAAASDDIAERSQGALATDLAAVADGAEVELGGLKEHVLIGTRGPIRLSDLFATRCLEAVTHTLDLDREAPLHREALAVVVRLLADAFADRHPGRAVELRVPPFAAVQVIEGTVHRRGTPPAVVEVRPQEWVLLATGRIGWDEARVTASGERSDLSSLLPVLS